MADQGSASTGSPAALTIMQTSGPGLVHTGHDWILDLGSIQAGQVVGTFHFGVLNDQPTANGDALAVTSDVSADAAFRVFGAPAYDAIVPGSGRGDTAVTIDASAPGQHAETIVLHPVDIAADGIRTSLPDETVRILMDVVGGIGGAGAIPAGAFASNLARPGADQDLATTPITLGGEHFARIENLGSWSAGADLSFAPSSVAAASYGPNYLFAVFQDVHANLTAAGAGVHDVDVVGGKGGELDLGAGGQSVVWSFASNGAGDGNTASIDAGSGNDAILVTAIGLNGLDDQLAPTSTLPYAIYPGGVMRSPSFYDGSFSTAVVHPGAGDDTVTIQGKVAVTLLLGQGDGYDSVSGFVSGTSHIQIGGVDPAATTAAAATEGGQSGLLLTYGSAGDSVFLAGLGALNGGDVIYANVPQPAPAGGAAAAPTGFASVDQAEAARLYDTVLDRKPDAPGLDFWTHSLDSGTPLQAVADGFMQSPEWQARYGTPDNQAFVETLYRNVLDRAGESGGVDFWTGHLNNGAASRGEVVVAFSESPEHVAKVAADDFLA
jgi:hypothetical protein